MSDTTTEDAGPPAEEFKIRHLAVACYAMGFTQWVYRSEHRVILSPDFMLPARDMIQSGDLVVVSCKTTGAVAMYHVDPESRIRRMLVSA